MLNPGDVIDGRYLVGDLLGRGGMAEVFRATDTTSARAVAVKVLRSVEPGCTLRFRSEADVLARLDHPGLVRLRDTGCHAGSPYLVLDLADGPTLAGELADGPIGLDRTLTVGATVAEALAHAHRAGVVHRDVKPSNILFDRDGRALLADFGIARLPGTPSLTGTGQVVGSARYMAPEQVAGEPTGPPVDIYALGLVLIECLTGRACYPGGQAEAALVRLSCRPAIPSDLPPWLHDVLSAMTARDPAWRPAPDAVVAALRARSAEPVVAVTVESAVAGGETEPAAGDARGRAGAVTGSVVGAAAAGRNARASAATSGGPAVRAPMGRRTTLAAAAVSALLAGLAGVLTWGVADSGQSAGQTDAASSATSTTVVSSAAPPSSTVPPSTTPGSRAASPEAPASPPPAVGAPPPATASPETMPSTAAPVGRGNNAGNQGRGQSPEIADDPGADNSGSSGNGRSSRP